METEAHVPIFALQEKEIDMTDKVTFERIAPVVPVMDLDAALDRYLHLGFAVEPS